jgi:HSP20 family protein
MTASKLNPWNWLRKEREQEGGLPVSRRPEGRAALSPMDHIHAEFDRLADTMLRGFGLSGGWPAAAGDTRLAETAIKAKVDIYGTEKEYVIEADLPGVDEKDVSIELTDDLLVITAEKRRDEKTEDKGYYRVERSFGSYRRVLDVPDDADRNAIKAKFDKGVLCITMPRTAKVERKGRTIPIQSA